jgi:hypothetical protein
MNKRNTLLFVALNFCLGTSALGQQFMTREGHVHFFSSTPIENIEADNHQMSGLLDAATGEFAFQIQMRGFHFEKALMEEHFNESYLESEKHPKATFLGQIQDWSDALSDGTSQKVVAKGTFNIHGVEQPADISGELRWTGESWVLGAQFEVSLEAHNIQIPAVVKDNISPVIAVDVHATLNPR